MFDEIVKQGAQAAARGKGLLDCPFLRLNQLPAHSNQPLHLWRGKVEAWEMGWHQQRQQRPPTHQL